MRYYMGKIHNYLQHLLLVRMFCYNQDNQASEWVQTEVVAYAVSFDFGPSYEEANTVYVADGDTFALPTVEEIAGYDFGGWFNAPTNGVKYENATVTSMLSLSIGTTMLTSPF
jgi:hypothetical protein